MAKNVGIKTRKYELMYIVKATLPDAQKKLAIGKIKEQLEKLHGFVEEEDVWGKRFMAYPIKKHQEGYYVVSNISMPPEETKEFSRLMHINADIMRFLLRSVDNFESISVPGEVKEELQNRSK